LVARWSRKVRCVRFCVRCAGEGRQQILRERQERPAIGSRSWRGRGQLGDDPLVGRDRVEGRIPAPLELRRHEPVRRIDRVVLTPGTLGFVAELLEFERSVVGQ
jgi:hypothetical protein